MDFQYTSQDNSTSNRVQIPQGNINVEYTSLSNVVQANRIDPMVQMLEELRSLKRQNEMNDEANKKIIKTLTEEIIALRMEVKQLKHYVIPQSEKSLLPTLPFYTLSELKSFDEKILSDEAMKSELKSVLERVGGTDFPTFLRFAIKAVVSDELAINLTWRGTSEKPSIQRFTLFRIIRDMCHSKYNTATNLDINRVFQQHFLHAKDRVIKRQRKALQNV